MLKKLRHHPQVKRLQRQAVETGQRLADHHISLAVTGLSGSGKTAFITSFVNQLLEARNGANLPFFSVLQQGRLLGVRQDMQPDLTVGQFAYQDALACLRDASPRWPASTNGVSQIRLMLRYQPSHGLRKLISEQSTLTLDITDYPGEWLLDLPLLEMSFRQWCEQFKRQMQNPKRQSIMQPFLQALKNLDGQKKFDEQECQGVSSLFTECLNKTREQGFQLIQPGRFVLPGELAGAPVLAFFPLMDIPAQEDTAGRNEQACLHHVLQQRFEAYKEHVVKPFYKQHFRRFDRQIVLVDCLSALNKGQHSFDDLKEAIDWLLGSFHYGRSNILKRLFSPKIDKLMFAASKADHVTPDQHENLVRLLDSLVTEARKNMQFDGVATESTAFASVQASEPSVTLYEKQSLQVLRGRNPSGKSLTLFPGEVPAACPDEVFWQQQGFAFPQFLPRQMAPGDVVPHIRLDQVLEFVIGDKVR